MNTTKDINYFWKDHPTIQRLIGFIPYTNKRVEEEKQAHCRKCGVSLIYEGEEDSICGNCAGE